MKHRLQSSSSASLCQNRLLQDLLSKFNLASATSLFQDAGMQTPQVRSEPSLSCTQLLRQQNHHIRQLYVRADVVHRKVQASVQECVDFLASDRGGHVNVTLAVICRMLANFQTQI